MVAQRSIDMKTLTEILDEMKLLDAVAMVADGLPVEVRSASLTLVMPAASLEGVAAVAPSLDKNGMGEFRAHFWGDVRIGRLTVSFLASRPATAEDVLATLPPSAITVVPVPAEVRMCDETAGAAEVPRG